MSVQEIARTVIASSRSSPPTGVVGYIALGKRSGSPCRSPTRSPQPATRRRRRRPAASWRWRALGEPAPQAQRGDLRGELDRQHRIGKASERSWPIDPAGDEQERHHARQPKHEAEDIEPAAAGERRHVGVGARRSGAAAARRRSMRRAPMLAPADLDVERHIERHRRLGGAAMTRLITAAASSSRPSGTSNTSSSWTCSSIRTPSSPARRARRPSAPSRA